MLYVLAYMHMFPPPSFPSSNANRNETSLESSSLRKREKKGKPAEYLTLLKRLLTENTVAVVGYVYQSMLFPVNLCAHSSCPCFAYAA